jgi:ActR/RegA family two-component response regulator
MARPVILFADNDPAYLEECGRFLEVSGFKVIKAPDVTKAKTILECGGVDLAIIDMRLTNDSDKRDVSGLKLAQTSAPNIHKIVLSHFPTFEAAKEALGQKLVGLAPASDFVDKAAGNQSLLTAVRQTLNSRSRYHKMSDTLAQRLDSDYRDARWQSLMNYWIGLFVVIVGVALIFAGSYLALKSVTAMAVIMALAGVITQASSALFFKRTDSANERMDRYHRELIETRRLENLLEACGEMRNYETQERYKGQVIAAATERWLGQGPDAPHTPARASQSAGSNGREDEL